MARHKETGRRTFGRKNGVSRRSFLAGGAGAIGLGAVAVGGTYLLTDDDPDSPGDGNDTPDDPRITTIDPGPLQLQVGTGDHPGRVTVLTGDDRELIHFDGYRLTNSIGTREATVDDPGNGSPSVGPVHVEFEVSDSDYTAAVTYRADGSVVTADWEFTVPGDGYEGDPEDGRTQLRGGRIYRTLVDADTESELHLPATRWVRDPGNGVPFLERVNELHFAEWTSTNEPEEQRICGCLSVPNSLSRSVDMVSAPPAPPDGDGDDIWRSRFEFRADPVVGTSRDLIDNGRVLLAGAVLGGTGIPDPTVDIIGPGTYNILTEGGTQTFTAGVAGQGTAEIEVVAREFSGEEVHRSTHTVEIPSDAQYVDTDIDIELPGPRSWCSLEVTCSDSFARTSAAVWPEYDYGPPDQSIIGLSGFSTDATADTSSSPGLDSAEDARGLWQRIGVKHLRNPWVDADLAEEMDLNTAVQPSGSAGKFSEDTLDSGGETFTEWATSNIERGRKAGAEHFELLNEWNIDGTDTRKLATEYTNDWLLPFRDEMDRQGTDAKLIAMALAGWDADFLDVIHDNGGWDVLDGIAEHAGRGNYVPDYDGGRWNFLGQVRQARAYLDGHAETDGEDDKDTVDELWLTECYACTRPNGWWYDDERTSADSVLLSLLLAKAEGADGTHWFQLSDGVWHDKNGVSAEDAEYHYGLLRTDRSPKPSLPAFAFAAEILDDASFHGWIESPHPDLRGLRFSQDDSTYWVLWNRVDGYLHNADHGADGYFPHPEPWIVPDSATLKVDVAGATKVQNVLGQEQELDGETVTVGASPVVVTGDIDDDLTGPTEVSGETSVDLTDITVERDEDSDTSLVIEGTNGTDRSLTLRVMGRQVDGEVEEETVKVESGEFSETVDLGDAMPPEESVPGASVAGAANIRPQVRIMAQRREKTVPEASESQVYRAEYYRSV